MKDVERQTSFDMVEGLQILENHLSMMRVIGVISVDGVLVNDAPTLSQTVASIARCFELSANA